MDDVIFAFFTKAFGVIGDAANHNNGLVGIFFDSGEAGAQSESDCQTSYKLMPRLLPY